MTVGASTSAADGPSTSKGTISGSRDPKNQPWIEKYRPQTLDDVAANKEIIDTIKRLTDENRLPHLLLYGPPGTHALVRSVGPRAMCRMWQCSGCPVPLDTFDTAATMLHCSRAVVPASGWE